MRLFSTNPANELGPVLNNGNPYLKINFAILDRDGTSQTVRIYDGTVLMKDDTVVSALQVGDVVNIDKSKILGNALRCSDGS